MTTDENGQGETGSRTGTAVEHELAEQHRIAVARTGRLVRNLTALADRYDTAAQDGDARTADLRRRVALMRATAASGHRLVRSLAPPVLRVVEHSALPPTEPAHEPSSPERSSAPLTRLEERAIVRQAQGLLMQRSGLTPDEAFHAMSLAVTAPGTLRGVADHVLRWGELPPTDVSTRSPRIGSERSRDASAEASAAMLTAVIEHAGLGIALLGPDGIAFRANPAFSRMLGYGQDELLTMRFADYTHPEDVEHEEAQFAQVLAGELDGYRVEKRYVRRDRDVVWAALTVSAVRRADGALLCAVGMVEDITEQRQLHADLQHQALHDHLTGLPNRRLFDDRLAHAQRLAWRRDHGLAVILLDLDGFKAVNDAFGHAAGDEVLVAVAATLAAACRDSDTVARVGGDEFAVVCEGPGATQHATALAGRLRTALAVTLTLSSGEQTSVSASVGCAVADPAGEDDTLLRRADEDMYRCKEHELGERGRGA